MDRTDHNAKATNPDEIDLHHEELRRARQELEESRRRFSDLYDFIFLIDVGLPHMDGYELAAMLKRQSTAKYALYVAVSGFKRRERAEGGDQFAEYFSKPVDVPALLALFDQR